MCRVCTVCVPCVCTRYAKVPNDQNTKRVVERAFNDFDADGSRNVSISEFISALERFGMHVAGKRPGVGGLPMDVVQALFDKYDKDGSGAIDYKEFTTGLFAADDEQAKPPPGPPPPTKKIGKPVHDATAHLKESNHIFGPLARK